MDRHICREPVAMESPRADDLEWPKNRQLRESRSIQMHEAALQRIDGSLGAIARAHFVEK